MEYTLQQCYFIGKAGVWAQYIRGDRQPKREHHFKPKTTYYAEYGPYVNVMEFSDEQFAEYIRGFADAWAFQEERQRLYETRKAARNGKPWTKGDR